MMTYITILKSVILSSCMLYAVHSLNLLKYHKHAFERTFHERCDKYPFVDQYINKMEHSDERYLTFVYQQNGLRNGGLGDKIGGLVSAVAMALRFNRTLIVRSDNDMHETFRPYHPTDIHNPNPKYSWGNFTSWSNYDWKYANNDATEYDLYDCINNTGQKNSHCSMKDGDANTPHILYRSNRAYLCYYDNNKGSVANQQMNDILGVNSTSDLLEVAGCMLRLALWPTERLWEEVGKHLHDFESSMGIVHNDNAMQRRRRNRRAQMSNDKISTTSTVTNNNDHSNNDVTSTTTSTTLDEESTSDISIVQVGMHFRCGDNSYIKHGGYDHMCVYNPEDSVETNKNKFPLGNPYEIGVCAQRSLHSYIIDIMEGRSEPGKLGIMTTTTSTSTISHSNTILPILEITSRSNILPIVFIASDNVMSSLQMNMTVNLPTSIVSPQGCHIEMDPSKQCHLYTVSQWFILALSDLLITQAGIPSSFSRYAGIYGLKSNPFRNGQECDVPFSSMEQSHKQISNWFC